jgi:7-carboxy-7-deazaguanine synthase
MNKIGIVNVFRTIQGEGLLSGVPMVFVRTSGCSVGCPQCDTNYIPRNMTFIDKVVESVSLLQTGGWVWVTGGEPTDWKSVHQLSTELRSSGYKTAIATSGCRWFDRGVWDFVSVSPHSKCISMDAGNQVNLVPGLGWVGIEDTAVFESMDFSERYITPLYGDRDSLKSCIEFVLQNDKWRLGVQSHKEWNLP